MNMINPCQIKNSKTNHEVMVRRLKSREFRQTTKEEKRGFQFDFYLSWIFT